MALLKYASNLHLICIKKSANWELNMVLFDANLFQIVPKKCRKLMLVKSYKGAGTKIQKCLVGSL